MGYDLLSLLRLAFVSLSDSVDDVDGVDGIDNGAENLTPSEQFGWRRLMIQVTESFSLRQLAKQTGLRRDNFLRPDRLLGRSLHNHQPGFPTFIARMDWLLAPSRGRRAWETKI